MVTAIDPFLKQPLLMFMMLGREGVTVDTKHIIHTYVLLYNKIKKCHCFKSLGLIQRAGVASHRPLYFKLCTLLLNDTLTIKYFILSNTVASTRTTTTVQPIWGVAEHPMARVHNYNDL